MARTHFDGPVSSAEGYEVDETDVIDGDGALAKSGMVGTTTIADDAVTNAKSAPAAGKWASGSLSDASTNAGIFSWQNPESSKILVDMVIIDITSAASDTSDSTMDVGVDGDGTGTSDTLIDDLSTQSVHVGNNGDDSGTNGAAVRKVDENGGTNDYITGSEATAAVTGMAGNYYIHYRTVA